MLPQLWCSSHKCSLHEVSEHGGRPSWKPPSEVWSGLPPFFSSPAAGEPPLCPDEQRVCTHLVKRALQESADLSTLILRTGGQVCCKDKQHACSYTVRTI